MLRSKSKFIFLQESPPLRQLTLETCYQEIIQSGHHMWVDDNVNQQQRIKHERESKGAAINTLLLIHIGTYSLYTDMDIC